VLAAAREAHDACVSTSDLTPAALRAKGTPMSRNRQLLCLAYAAIALIALFATWSQNLFYFHPEDGALLGFVRATGRFWPDTLATPASVSITVDIALFTLAASIFLILEARRLGIRFAWAYVILGLLVAISVTFPLFLIARERRLAQRSDVTAEPAMTRADRNTLVALGVVSAVFSLWTIWR
jgi:hypothetical protein